jgi:Flp pilus assembly protein TadD
MRCFGRRGFAAVALAVVVCVGGCAAFQGARLYRRGSVALERGEIERALADLERAAALVPHASEIQNHLGLAYAASGRERDALRAFRRAVELDCDNRQALHNLAVAESTAGQAEP